MPDDRQQQVCHRRVFASEAQTFLDEFDAYSTFGQRLYQPAKIVQVRRQAVHAVHNYRVSLPSERQQSVELRLLRVLGRGLVSKRVIRENGKIRR